ncbi:MAG: fibronectin type III domain-containing protein, partial [Clostridia bacterium]|nr:fibronectin type III domain-containing protein [Clostridia bacterium]
IEPVDNAFVKDFTLTDVLKASTVFNKKENAYKFKPIAERGTVKVIRDQVAPNSLTLVSEPEYFSFKIPGINSETLFFSLDGKVYDSLSIENYNEDAAVYFKQGVDGKVYSKVLKMPGRYYDIYVGDTQLSDDNMAQFAAKGLSYDYLTDTLTLNNYIGEMEACYKGSAPHAVIYSKSDLTVCVLGASRITNTTEQVTYKNAAAALKADGNIRFTGSGTLTLKNSCEAFREQYGVYCTGAAVLDMNGGKLNIVLNPNQDIVADKAYGIFGELQCLNGTLEVNSLYGDERYPQKIVEPVSGDIDVNSASSYTLKLGQTASSRTAFTGGINAVANADTGYRSMLLICSHTHSYDVKEKSKTFIAVPATCTTENVYYMSCVCGCYTTEQTFGGEGRDAHRWQEVKGRAPTYDAPGYTDYLVCTVCGIARHYQELPQLERPTAPPVPTGLAAASNAPGAITVTWDAAEHATRYDVYSMIGGDYVKIGSTAETSYTHTGLTPGETYYYKVVAVNESELGELASAMSAAVSAKPAAEPPATHSITVANGTASVSSAAKGTTVTITASVPESKEFDRWEVVKGDITLADASKATTTFVMGDLDVEVKAVFKDIFHTVTVTDGTASVSSATKGTTVTITAAAAPEGKAFDKWEVVKGGITLADVTANVTTFVMGDLDVEVKAAYKDLPSEKHSVTVTSGTADKSTAAKGETVTVTASAAPEGKAFDKWEVVKGNITLADVTSTVTTFVMGDLNVEVKAVYRDIGSSGEEGLFGDIDGDGNITAADARLALRMSVDIMHDDGIPFTDKQITAADVDRDGRVTGADARLLLRKAVGLEVLSEGWAGPV